MTAINFTANPVTSQKLAAEKLARLQELKPLKELSKPAQKNNIEKLPTQKEFGKRFLEISKKTDAQKAATEDLLLALEEQMRLEPQNIELRKAYDAIKSSL